MNNDDTYVSLMKDFNNSQCLNWMMTAVILSHPIPPEEATSEAIILSNMNSTMLLRFPPEVGVLVIYSLTKVIHS